MNIDVLSFNKHISSALEDQTLLVLRWARQASGSPVFSNQQGRSRKRHIIGTRTMQIPQWRPSPTLGAAGNEREGRKFTLMKTGESLLLQVTAPWP